MGFKVPEGSKIDSQDCAQLSATPTRIHVNSPSILFHTRSTFHYDKLCVKRPQNLSLRESQIGVEPQLESERLLLIGYVITQLLKRDSHLCDTEDRIYVYHRTAEIAEKLCTVLNVIGTLSALMLWVCFWGNDLIQMISYIQEDLGICKPKPSLAKKKTHPCH